VSSRISVIIGAAECGAIDEVAFLGEVVVERSMDGCELLQ